MKKEVWFLNFHLTNKETLQFTFETEKECEDEKNRVLKSGEITGESIGGRKYWYPKRRINSIAIYKS